MNLNEAEIMGLILGSSLLYAWGGMGPKWIRRFVLPVFLCVGAFLGGISVIKACIALPLMIVAFSLGYGENSPIWKRILTILAYSLCLLPLASGWNGLLTLITPAIFGGLYYISRKVNWFTWRIVELSTGFSLGVVTVLLILTK